VEIQARVILDTNVLMSRLLLPESVAARAVRRVLDRVVPLVSEATLGELADTLSKPRFDRYVSIEDRRRFFELFARVAEWVAVTSTLRVCRDARDNKFLELAVDGEATLLVTGDKDLLALAPFRSTQILTPAELLELPDSSLT
jgi:putative PIN family toxin of toxin-antitoxin system